MALNSFTDGTCPDRPASLEFASFPCSPEIDYVWGEVDEQIARGNEVAIIVAKPLVAELGAVDYFCDEHYLTTAVVDIATQIFSRRIELVIEHMHPQIIDPVHQAILREGFRLDFANLDFFR